MVSINSRTCFVLRKYLLHRMGSSEGTLFLNRFGNPLGERGVQKIIRKYFGIAGVVGGSVHTLRHTFGIQRVTEGTDAITLQQILGLRDPRAASVYISISREAI